MNLLLDSHAFLWWRLDDKRLPERAKAAIADPERRAFLSVATIWELAIKVGLGKLPSAAPSIAELARDDPVSEFELLPIQPRHAVGAGMLEIPHRDPFDRLLIYQARSESLILVSNEKLFDNFGVERIWN